MWMADPHVISELREKRALVAGLIEKLERKLEQHRADLTHIDGVLRLFQPDRDPGDIKPRPAGVDRKGASGSSMTEPAKVFEDRIYPGNWRVEGEDDDGGVEVTIFSGPDARDRAFQYAASLVVAFFAYGIRSIAHRSTLSAGHGL